VWAGAGGPLAAPTLVVTQLAGATLLARAVDGRGPTRVGRESVAFGGGFLLFLALFFAHYAGYDLSIPMGRTVLFVAAGAALLLASIVAPADARPPVPAFSWGRVAALGVLALLPLTRPLLGPALVDDGGPRPGARPGHVVVGEPIRVVSFNLHNGFDEAGGFALDEMLLALRRQDADVIALQEVSRGWVVNGSADLYELARESLGLVGVPGPSVVPDWGNAVFTRWAPSGATVVPLPPRGLSLPRAAALVDLEAPEDETRRLRILATHFHYKTGDDPIRNEQARFVATELGAPPDTMPSILLGDFNAEPGSECLAILASGGWSDVFAVDEADAEVDAEALTYPSGEPTRRIDTIFFRGPWRLLRAEAAPPWGSDHRAVIAELLLEPRLELNDSESGS
jgi:endonuclease/exonuclease/phosphatase family metal-dependent hydrolase